MDKVTRILKMYSMLLSGEGVRKAAFCAEAEINPRSFDRDIEDVRIYLSEMYSAEEVVYDKRMDAYYLSIAPPQRLEDTEYRFLEGVLAGMNLLCKDELRGMLSHLAANTQSRAQADCSCKKRLQDYAEPESAQPIMKMHDDLVRVLEWQDVIEIQYLDEGAAEYRAIAVIPCKLNYNNGSISLTAFEEGNAGETQSYRIDRIYSFKTCRKLTRKEAEAVKKITKTGEG